jgi:hypothetical protein
MSNLETTAMRTAGSAAVISRIAADPGSAVAIQSTPFFRFQGMNRQRE